MSKIISDYHMHTPLCGHAVGEPAEYAQKAIESGLGEIGFSDHAPMVTGPMPKVTMDRGELPIYYRMIESVREEFKSKLTIKIAIEADYLSGLEDKTKQLLSVYKFDYVIGSVHFIKKWGFDNPDEGGKWNEKNINDVYRDYFELLRKSAESKLFDIIAHADLVKKFGHRPTENILNEVKKNAEVFKACGVAVEINTSGLRKPVKEMYPAFEHMKIYAQAEIPLTFGSDAHDPMDVARDFKLAYEAAVSAGYKEYVLFKNRKIERVIKL